MRNNAIFNRTAVTINPISANRISMFDSPNKNLLPVNKTMVNIYNIPIDAATDEEIATDKIINDL